MCCETTKYQDDNAKLRLVFKMTYLSVHRSEVTDIPEIIYDQILGIYILN